MGQRCVVMRSSAPADMWCITHCAQAADGSLDARAGLLGDACHSMVPLLAQGANMAIEDGFILGRCLKEYRDDLPAALMRYENARRDRTRRAVEGSAANIQRFHNPQLSDPAEARKYVDREWAEE